MYRAPRLAPVLAALALALAGPARAQDDAFPEDEPEAPDQGMIQQEVMWSDENFDQWVFNGRGDANSVRTRLDSLLKLQVESVDRACGLTDAQKEKLRLAGRGDVKHFFDKVAEKKRVFQALKNDRNKINNIFQEIQPLQMVLASGPFDEGSVFFKTIRTTLDEAQAKKYDDALKQKRRFRYRAKVDLMIGMLDNAVALRADQRERLATLLLEGTEPPKKSGQYDYYVVMLQASRLPRDKVKAIFDDAQWKIVAQQLDQGRGLEQFLKQNGYLDDDGKPEPAPAAPAPAAAVREVEG